MLKNFILTTGVSFAVAFSVLLLLLHGEIGRVVLDRPNERSLHTVAVPRAGGLAIMAGIIAAWGMAWQPELFPLTCSLIFLVVLSFFDDLYGLPAGWRLAAHFLAAAFFLGCYMPSVLDQGWWLLLVLLLAIVWITNLYNFMDGSDGLAGGMALFGFSFYAFGAWQAGDGELAFPALAIAAACGAFLLFNFHPARIFMGDVGSIPLGFLAATWGLLGWQRGDWPLWFPLLVFSPFVVDASVTLLKRLLRREKIWQAHRGHYYQRLVQMGWGHRRTALVEYILMALAGGSALWLASQVWALQVMGLMLWGAIYYALAIAVDRLWFKLQPPKMDIANR